MYLSTIETSWPACFPDGSRQIIHSLSSYRPCSLPLFSSISSLIPRCCEKLFAAPAPTFQGRSIQRRLLLGLVLFSASQENKLQSFALRACPIWHLVCRPDHTPASARPFLFQSFFTSIVYCVIYLAGRAHPSHSLSHNRSLSS